MLHWHSNFCKVDPEGNHTSEVRPVGYADAYAIKKEDFSPRPKDMGKVEGDCYICMCEFDDDMPPMSPPGCKYGHGEGRFDEETMTMKDSGPAHGDCLM